MIILNEKVFDHIDNELIILLSIDSWIDTFDIKFTIEYGRLIYIWSEMIQEWFTLLQSNENNLTN